ncbi:MAG: SMP-30/gluconolactonase/LRE family protein [Deltaproteobacteria bacterium]|jgi:sugar lactone lactonase YvrE|nr:SMP-30/gluconolactonase/LRE family protein [Deltaproteobacteria bacterium]
MIELTLSPFAEGLRFGEAPRWHAGRLWLSDQTGRRIYSAGEDAVLRIEHELDFQPSGLGWLPDGRLLAVSMLDHRLMREDGRGGFEVVAELAAYCGGKLNDMIVDAAGRAYIGNIGFDEESFDPSQEGFVLPTTSLVRVDPDGRHGVVAQDLACPNGMGISEDGRTLVVGQSGSPEILAFEIEPDGALSNRRVYARLPGDFGPDGLCLDAEGGVWAADPQGQAFLRVRPGGEITHRIDTGGRAAIACVLGGADRRTLFAITCWTISHTASLTRRGGTVETLRVDVPGAGRP